ncbi:MULTISPECIES: multidrug effflux MFS transporter [unclassified Rhizobium]|uniref:multidrug effflux MFS transporter n=1 Tax=unclassified Rhizobium TaxID=2613769 RepID=UPI001C83EB47|nr:MULTISPECIES: multidrug effflux MFS transporter [unclassified Rhizobium]MBX5165237.1 multidrug effflux MFS transporter [Rhizobium sp. NZLR4b]MBX5189209.1 multidrug effflux MFS transporter [Rhizobium sp. NZLR3b]MBX5197643.1 multidrug effflux MFS transporter [Rhizobium sp. NZLR10]MBX5208947.1 multidrug effflux MFS transporter [Rhizobium sp. NZLR11]
MDEQRTVAERIGSSVSTPSRLREFQRLAILSTLMAFAAISTDLYLPAIPNMSASLGASQSTLEWTVSGYLIGFSLGQLFWGPISDRFGRRMPIAIGIVIFIIGSAGCALATDGWQLIGWRIIQALGACASVVLSRAIVRDLYGRDRAARVLSTLITVMAIAPLAGPSLGAQILVFGSWQVIFWVLVVIGMATLAGLFTLPESLASDNRNHEPLTKALAAYGSLLRNRKLVGYAGTAGFFFSGTFAYIASSAFAFIDFYGLSPESYALLFAVGIVGLMISNQINARLVTRLGSDRMLLIGAIGAAITGLVVAVVTFTGLGGVWGLAISTWLFIGMNGFIVANSISGALADFPHRAGTVSALLGAIQYGSGIGGSAAVGLFANGTPAPMGCMFAVAGLGCLLSVLWMSSTGDHEVGPSTSKNGS